VDGNFVAMVRHRRCSVDAAMHETSLSSLTSGGAKSGRADCHGYLDSVLDLPTSRLFYLVQQPLRSASLAHASELPSGLFVISG
jgi:hypothetical protein